MWIAIFAPWLGLGWSEVGIIGWFTILFSTVPTYSVDGSQLFVLPPCFFFKCGIKFMAAIFNFAFGSIVSIIFMCPTWFTKFLLPTISPTALSLVSISYSPISSPFMVIYIYLWFDIVFSGCEYNDLLQHCHLLLVIIFHLLQLVLHFLRASCSEAMALVMASS